MPKTILYAKIIFLLFFFLQLKFTCAHEDDYLCTSQFPNENQIRYVCQYSNLSCKLTQWDDKKREHILTHQGRFLLNCHEAWDFRHTSEFIETDPSLIQRNRLIQKCYFFSKLLKSEKLENFFQQVLKFASYNHFTENSTFPEVFFPLSEDSAYFFKDKISKIFDIHICDRCILRPEHLEQCQPTEEDRSILENVLNDETEVPSILFVGFDQTIPSEGSEILANTPIYQHSLFLSGWGTRPEGNYNQIKFCFCQLGEILKQYPQLNRFFDYIIIGGQTIEYIPKVAWEAFARMIKPEGRLVYKNIFHSHLHFPQFVNQLLCEASNKNFHVYACSNLEEPIYQEICNYAGFNNKPTWGDFCYGQCLIQPQCIVWHKYSE